MPVAPPSVVPPKPAHTMSSSQSMAEYYQKSAQYAPVEVSQDRDDDTSHRSAATSMLFRLCLYGFFIELKPSEAYLNTFLTSEKAHVLGFSNQVTNDDIYPWFTYGQMLMLVAMPLFVERFQYRTVLLIESVGFLFTRLLLLWATSLFWMQVTYAVGTASKVVYLCMIYREVKQEEYHRATAVVWAASLGGQFAAGVLGQILVSFHASLWLLNYISLANVCVAFVVALYGLQWFLFCGGIVLLLLSFSQTVAPTLTSSYVSYVLYGCAYYALITTVSAELAKQCTTNEYAKQFALVALGAAVLETVVTFLLQGTSTHTTTWWFGGITMVHCLLVVFYVLAFGRVRHDDVPTLPVESTLPLHIV
ncbi:hypothetical protein B5M09_003668 [Aphanomyces astaci]|uniref:Major facilitator superfamily (MFS) profile domain-containing protein n=2 Tax=Aphanomyces astaci TaxID=112090 RepID=A0A3R7X468_APHAT|nr:hypothetical protein B5M09_003668 [Aphanomyces astaci]